MKGIVLGCGRGVRRLDPTKSYPIHLLEIGNGRALDWILGSLRQNSIQEISYVGGYHIEKVVESFPNLRFHFYSQWMQGTEVQALASVAPDLIGPLLISTSGIVFHAEAIRKLIAAHRESGTDLTYGVYREIDGSDAVGVLCATAAGADLLKKSLEKSVSLHLLNLVESVPASYRVDISDQVSVLNDRFSLARFAFGTKAQTLHRLRGLVRNSVIFDQVCFCVTDWKKDPSAILDRIQKELPFEKVVVRSSATTEDSWTQSQAGKFTSVLDIDGSNRESISRGIQEVLGSYPADESTHEVFVQKQAMGVQASGVLFTRDLGTGAPYYVVNWDSSGRTDTVTSGAGQRLETCYLLRPLRALPNNPLLRSLVSAAAELEDLLHFDALDIEFAIGAAGEVFVLQVRPMVTPKRNAQVADADISDEVSLIEEFCKGRFGRQPLLAGDTTVLGVMPDWNPAEMIGECPRPLALSLYQKMITDGPWARARAQLGYFDVGYRPLMLTLGGRPYIDCRVSFNSLLPAELSEPVRDWIVNGYVTRLKKFPEFHDKIEFEVAATCLTTTFFNRTIAELQSENVPAEALREYTEALRSLTRNLLTQKRGKISDLLKNLEGLNERRSRIQTSTASGLSDKAVQLSLLLQDCIELGTIPFSILARYAFVAMSFLKSFRDEGVLSKADYDEILLNIPTVASDFSRDLQRTQSGELLREDFLSEYGHIRPGSYDLLSPNLRQGSEKYLFVEGPARAASHRPQIGRARELLEKRSGEITQLLAKLGLDVSAAQVTEFILVAIPAREKSKFEFTKNLNAQLEVVASMAAPLALTLEDISYLSVETLLRLATDQISCGGVTDVGRTVGFNKKRFELTKALRLPPLLTKTEDLACHYLMEGQPNFITSKQVTGGLNLLDAGFSPSTLGASLAGKIVAIESADPGYDWIFAHPIKGLITKYGGVASHMAIRAAEFGLPSAIGCGESLFTKICQGRDVHLNCLDKQIRVLQ